jgi:hypothetical protein
MFAGDELRVPLLSRREKRPPVRVARERMFDAPLVRQEKPAKEKPEQVAAAHEAGSAKSSLAPAKAESASASSGETLQASHQADIGRGGGDAPNTGSGESGTAVAKSRASAIAAQTGGAVAAPAESSSGAQPPRSRFDAVWELPPTESADANATVADRRWPSEATH